MNSQVGALPSLPSSLSCLPQVQLSSAMAAERRFRLFNSIKARIRQFDFHYKHSNDSLPSYTFRSFLSSLVFQLDINSDIPHTTYLAVRRAFFLLGNVEQHMRNVFGFFLRPTSNCLSPDEVKFMEILANNGRLARVANYRWRLESEIIQCTRDGWFVVFQTLTVNSEFLDRVFTPGSRAFSDYIRDVERYVGRFIYGGVRLAERARANGEQFHKYFAVVERGSATGRLHIHVVHMFKDLPPAWRGDPNADVNKPPTKVCLHKFFLFWRYGFSRPIACRFDANDAFTKIGWRWPVERVDGGFKPKVAKPCLALARYVSKYVCKEYIAGKSKDIFRCRMTRNLGMAEVNHLILEADDELLMCLAVIRDNNPFRIDGQTTVPTDLIRRAATIQLIRQLPMRTRWTYLRALRKQPSIIEQFRTMTRKKCNRNSKSIGDIPILNSKKTVGSDVTYDQVREAWLKSVYVTRKGSVVAGPTTVSA